MPRLTVLAIRAALVYLAVGFLFGGLILAHKGVPFLGSVWLLLPVHIEILLFGWLLQFVMAVAYWIAPRFSHAPRYGRVRLARAAFIALNGGLWAFLIGYGVRSPYLQAAGRTGLLLASACFIIHLAPRIKPLFTAAG